MHLISCKDDFDKTNTKTFDPKVYNGEKIHELVDILKPGDLICLERHHLYFKEVVDFNDHDNLPKDPKESYKSKYIVLNDIVYEKMYGSTKYVYMVDQFTFARAKKKDGSIGPWHYDFYNDHLIWAMLK